ncbi:Gfo/Idh/MocA family protein [Marivita sp. S2033]|uniref:Gfo/Idh/MocA family protein n=1 Tax=Marivita sp. S2033 TaxID=3373187 RepID=UPI003981B891
MRWALIGASRIASGYMIDALRVQPESEIVSVLSSDATRGARYAEDHAIPHSFTDLDALLDGPPIDAVYISTTNEKHHAQALMAIAAGKHVLCEKPLATSLADAIEMVSAADEEGVTFGTNHHLRNAGSHLAIRDLIDEGRIGDVQSVRVFHAVSLPQQLRGWRINDASAGGGVIPDITVHDADTVRFLLGEDPVDVIAKSATSGLGEGVEDSAMSVWSMPSGAMVQSHESFTHPFARTGIEIHGTKGSIHADGVMSQEPVGTIHLVDAQGRHEIGFETHNLYHRAVRLFSKAAAGSGRPSADGIDGVKSLAVALAVRESARSGTCQRVNYGEPSK